MPIPPIGVGVLPEGRPKNLPAQILHDIPEILGSAAAAAHQCEWAAEHPVLLPPKRRAASRHAHGTPSNILRNLKAERRRVAAALAAVVAGTLIVGVLFWRTIPGRCTS